MGNKKTMKLVQKVLKNENKRALYSDAELQYMSLQLLSMKLQRKRKKLQQKQNKGFGNE